MVSKGLGRTIKFRCWDGKQMKHEFLIQSDSGHVIGSPILMQFTGLLDSKGVEVYEGDIMLCPGGTYAKVIWYEQGYYTTEFIRGTTVPKDMESVWGIQHRAVVGDIYSNPELLNGKSKRSKKA